MEDKPQEGQLETTPCLSKRRMDDVLMVDAKVQTKLKTSEVEGKNDGANEAKAMESTAKYHDNFNLELS